MNAIKQRIKDVLSQYNPNDILSSAEEIVNKCGINGLMVSDVIQGQTVDYIFNLWIERKMNGNALPSSCEQKENKRYPLLPYSRLVFESLLQMPGVYYFKFIIRFDASINLNLLHEATELAIRNHPILQMKIDADGLQSYHPLHDVFNGQYHSISLVEEGNHTSLFLTFNRILGDFTSLLIFIEDVCRAYNHQNLEKDYYFEYLENLAKQSESIRYIASQTALIAEFGGITCPVRPCTDIPLDADVVPMAGEYVVDLSSYAAALERISAHEHVSMDALICLCSMLAIMDDNGTDDAALTWAYVGRDTIEEQRIFGSLHKDIPLKLHRASMHDMLRAIRNAMRSGIAHSDYPFTLTPPYSQLWNYAANVLHQPLLEDALASSPIPFEIVPVTSDQPAIAYSLFDIEIEDQPHLQVRFRYSATHYTEEHIRRFADLLTHACISLSHYALVYIDTLPFASRLEAQIAANTSANPDPKTNPVQSLQDFYHYATRYLTAMPWQGLDMSEDEGLFHRIDQSIGYFYYIFGDLQNDPEVARWLSAYDTEWGRWLSSADSWNDECLRLVQADPLFELSRYESPDHWHCWNDFFSRHLLPHSTNMRYPFISPSDGVVLRSPVKTASIAHWIDILGDCPYRNCFEGGDTFHIVLDMYDYHRFHAPLAGRVLDVRLIDGAHNAGGRIVWDDHQHRYRYDRLGDETFQMIEKRGVLVLQTAMGKVAIVPVGVAQVSSVNWLPSIQVGATIEQGDELGYFLCGGSDIVLFFEPGVSLPNLPIGEQLKADKPLFS